jgi:hypothetical protein
MIMTDIAIRVENLSKQYRIGGPQAAYKTMRESLTEAVQAPFRRLSSVLRGQASVVSNETIWVLKPRISRISTKRRRKLVRIRAIRGKKERSPLWLRSSTKNSPTPS